MFQRVNYYTEKGPKSDHTHRQTFIGNTATAHTLLDRSHGPYPHRCAVDDSSNADGKNVFVIGPTWSHMSLPQLAIDRVLGMFDISPIHAYMSLQPQRPAYFPNPAAPLSARLFANGSTAAPFMSDDDTSGPFGVSSSVVTQPIHEAAPAIARKYP
ncbi:hypothetical protein P153DRAFT_429992 [Dothidotthia symphoricarpi CBS 119687]|uniref:Uncharacterized protein n=1 Tax=Dothidotthia symphoricarpi CBS 119687 TaxID=1392245 RepID=A0A6A6AJM3_9PLEO|nr:uncharacterized protein P153DRAFT_429992 [Dothidotthia symphoricarpi CBS 119687]KAF2131766.1 hypothetical protein P153DRAFT_429992 [Dothidotthia symphoricarpi CBS 119687]